MADSLEENWWETDIPLKEESTEAAKENASQQSERNIPATKDDVKHDRLKKRKKSKQLKTDEEKPTKKKRRKKITDVLAAARDVDGPSHVEAFMTFMGKHFDGKLSSVELDEVKLDDSYFWPCVSSDSLDDYLKEMIPSWSAMVKDMDQVKGSPLVLIVTGAASRAVNIVRMFSNYDGQKVKIAKLFAKHMKLTDQMAYLERSVVHMGVGTPSRLQQLLDNDSLHLEQVSMILVDWTWRDAKLRRLVDIPETREQLFALLKKHFMAHLKEKKGRIALG